MKRYYLVFVFYLLSVTTLLISVTKADDKNIQAVQIVKGQPVIFLDKEAQEISNLKTQALKQVEFQTEFIAYGKAINLSPLLSLRNQYLTASTQQANAKARFMQAQKNMSRLTNLHKNEIVSTRKLQKQQLQWQSDKNLFQASNYQNQIIINNSNLQWGKTLTKWLTDGNSPQFDKLVNGDSTLLLITLPAGNSLQKQLKSIFIDPNGNRNSATKASFVNILPYLDTFSQGQQSIFLTDNPTIKAGMNITAWIPQQKQSQSGVIIPQSSLAWHLGQAFVFIKLDEEYFSHRTIDNPVKISNGYFIINDIKDGEEIVVTGTQMLLSHEFRSQIPDEDDD